MHHCDMPYLDYTALPDIAVNYRPIPLHVKKCLWDMPTHVRVVRPPMWAMACSSLARKLT